MGFVLDMRLANDTVVVGDWPLSRVLLMNDSQYPWLILVPRRADMRELYTLTADDQQQFMRESCALAAIMAELFAADKMNIANLGNIVAQLHIHHIARYASDPAWPGPVWGKHPAKPYAPNEADSLIQRLRPLLAAKFALT